MCHIAPVRATPVLALASVVVGTASVGCGGGGAPAVERDGYVARNVAVLDALPEFPRATTVSTESTECLTHDAPDAEVGGYWTTRTFRVPPAQPSRVVVFYRTRLLADGWQLEDDSGSPSVSVRRRGAYVHVLAARGEVTVAVDHAWKYCPGP